MRQGGRLKSCVARRDVALKRGARTQGGARREPGGGEGEEGNGKRERWSVGFWVRHRRWSCRREREGDRCPVDQSAQRRSLDAGESGHGGRRRLRQSEEGERCSRGRASGALGATEGQEGGEKGPREAATNRRANKRRAREAVRDAVGTEARRWQDEWGRWTRSKKRGERKGKREREGTRTTQRGGWGDVKAQRREKRETRNRQRRRTKAGDADRAWRMRRVKIGRLRSGHPQHWIAARSAVAGSLPAIALRAIVRTLPLV